MESLDTRVDAYDVIHTVGLQLFAAYSLESGQFKTGDMETKANCYENAF